MKPAFFLTFASHEKDIVKDCNHRADVPSSSILDSTCSFFLPWNTSPHHLCVSGSQVLKHLHVLNEIKGQMCFQQRNTDISPVSNAFSNCFLILHFPFHFRDARFLSLHPELQPFALYLLCFFFQHQYHFQHHVGLFAPAQLKMNQNPLLSSSVSLHGAHYTEVFSETAGVVLSMQCVHPYSLQLSVNSH